LQFAITQESKILNTEERWKKFWDGQVKPLHRDDPETLYKRHAAELKVLFKFLDPKSVLEVGCGNGALHKYLGFDKTLYRGVDFSPSMLGEFKKKYPQTELKCQSGHSYCDENKYDLVFSNGVIQCFDIEMLIEHFANAKKMMHRESLLICATVPWKVHRLRYLTGKIEEGMKSSIGVYVKRILLGDPIMGTWYDFENFKKLAKENGMTVSFYGSMEYLYRFHAVLKLSEGVA